LKAARWLVPLSATFVAALVRLSLVLRSEFPLNDGALFYLMTRELQQAGFRLPAYTAYNGVGIPFAYPPLGLYLAGLLASLGRLPLLQVFRFLPVALSLMTVPAFWALARALLPSGAAAALATYAFALLPASFTWLIMGGGVTRAAGLLFAILALYQGDALYTREGNRHILATGFWAGLAALSHLAMAWVAAASMALFFLTYGRSWRALARSVAAAGVALAITAPWWATVIAQHGLSPFLAAARSPEPPGASLLFFLMLLWTDEPWFPVLAGLALLGLLSCLAARRWFLPAWLLGLVLLDPRTVDTTGSLPLALLAGLGIVDVLLPPLNGGAGVAAAAGSAYASWDPARSRLARATLCALFVYASCSALVANSPVLVGLSSDERMAMEWVAQYTPQTSRFVVLTGDRAWGADRSSEWFPVLAARQSVATVQGREWLEGFMRSAYAYTMAQRCAAGDGSCLEAWAEEPGQSFTHVYIAKRSSAVGRSVTDDAAASIRNTLRADPRYRVLYDGPGATVLERVR